MNTKTTKTLVFAALIAAMILPFGGMQTASATNHSGENLTDAQLERMLSTAESRLAHYENLLSSAELLYDHRIDSIITHQAILDELDAIVENGGVLTDDQIALYDHTVSEIGYLEVRNANTEGDIRNYQAGIERYLAVIDWVQAELDSRDT